MLKKIVYIGGVARSGTSWLGQIFDSLPYTRYRFQPLFSYEFKNNVNEDSTQEEFNIFFENLFKTDTEFLTQSNKRKNGDYPFFKKDDIQDVLVFKENRYQTIIEPMLRKNKEVFFVGIIRNPCAVLNSWMKNEKEFPPNCSPLKDWRFGDCKNKGHEDYFGYYKWKEVTHMYLDLLDKFPNRVILIRYEDLVDNPINMTKELFDFCGFELQEQTKNFLLKSVSTKNETSYYSVYKNKNVKDKWKNELHPYIISEIENDLKNTILEKYLY